mmetsp:Transcript_40849/g.60545  ORF Transcript_40849/g.60545 Transcript_40849/m.60545 type:complete len:81 (+) Transcript_40849:451-693(+)
MNVSSEHFARASIDEIMSTTVVCHEYEIKDTCYGDRPRIAIQSLVEQSAPCDHSQNQRPSEKGGLFSVHRLEVKQGANVS